MEEENSNQLKRILIAPDKFKGTIDAAKICDLIKDKVLPSIYNQMDNIHVDSVPLSDGGDGFVDCIYRGLPESKIVKLSATGPMGEVRDTEYCINEQTLTAYIEVANISGLKFVKTENRNPYRASSIGVGELIKDAYQRGIKHVYVGAGGSAFNDLGIGALFSLGLQFIDSDSNIIGEKEFCGILDYNLECLKNATAAKWDENSNDILKNLSITFACDVTNPLLGERGCTYIFGPQKGVKPEDLEQIDSLLSHLILLMKEASEYDRTNVENESGSGASGGIVCGFRTFFLNCNIISGIEMISQHTDLLEKLYKCDILITGEGKFDNQTFEGKVISYLLSSIQNSHDKRFPKLVIILCGASEISDYNRKSVEEIDNLKVISLSELYGLDEAMNNPSKCIENGLIKHKSLFLQ